MNKYILFFIFLLIIAFSITPMKNRSKNHPQYNSQTESKAKLRFFLLDGVADTAGLLFLLFFVWAIFMTIYTRSWDEIGDLWNALLIFGFPIALLKLYTQRKKRSVETAESGSLGIQRTVDNEAEQDIDIYINNSYHTTVVKLEKDDKPKKCSGCGVFVSSKQVRCEYCNIPLD